jgi:FAD/FMN-containing dehydrogenase
MTIYTHDQVAATSSSRAAALRERCGDLVVIPGDPAYDQVRVPWNVAVDQRPAAVGLPRTAEDVQAIVRAAAALGLRAAPQSTGHAAGVLAQHDLSGVVLLRTDALAAVTIDADRRIAHIGGGAIWQSVVEAAAPHGLAAQHGSSPDVGVAGYLLGGGLSWYARSRGLAANDIVAIELVTADGEIVRAGVHEHHELFWALRGGGGNFGVVTGFELRLHPITDVYAGLFLWDIEHLDPVLRHWVAWGAEAPDEVTTSLRVMRFPPLPELPPFLRGRRVVVVDGVALGDDAHGEELVAGFRTLAPEMDTWGRTPASALTRLHMDPEGPTPSVGSGTLLCDLDEGGIRAFVDAVGPSARTSLLMAELRQLGGAVNRPVRDGGVVNRIDAAYVAFFVAVAATPELAVAGRVDAERARRALATWETGRSFLNFAERPVDPRTAYGHDAWVRLTRLRDRLDPQGVFLANHAVPRSLP